MGLPNAMILGWTVGILAAVAGAITALMRQYKIGPWNPEATLEDAPVQPPTLPKEPISAPSASQTSLLTFCAAIRDFEGKPGDLNYQLNNPGDCRPSPVGYLPKYQPVVIIDTNIDPQYLYHKGKFAKFPTYELGWEYLVNMVHFMATNHPTWTILEFFQHFAPTSDGNAPVGYAANVATRCDTIPSATLQELFG